MTTLALRDGWLASDSMVTRNGTTMPESVEKIWRVNDRCVAGFTGDMGGLAAAKRWTRGEMLDNARPRFKDSILLLVWPERVVEYSDDTDVEIAALTRGFYAWGSGMDLALGAMAAGADAMTAIQIAVEFNPLSGGTIRSMPVVNGSAVEDAHG